LTEGIGDTIRISLTEPPENEIVTAKKLVDYIKAGKCENDFESYVIKATTDFAPSLFSGKIQDFKLEDEKFPSEQLEELRLAILQATHVKITQTEYIACPGCGRTKYDIQNALERVKERTKGFAGLKIAVMGCIVNGPGEMAGADYGYVGAGDGKVHIYKGTDLIFKNVPEDIAVDKLLELIETESKLSE
jgi:(E)-4-hydroxy-3-methylbut-2-enyl-diphosphate synthase